MDLFQPELERAGYSRPLGEFRDLEKRIFVAMYPGRSVDDLLDHPDDSEPYCDRVRDEARAWALDDDLILNVLLDTRKHPKQHGGFPPAIRRPRPALYRQLTEAGCGIQEDAFIDLLAEILEDEYGDAFTPDTIRYRPRVARRYCAKIREKTGFSGLPDDLILRSINNARKAGVLSAGPGLDP